MNDGLIPGRYAKALYKHASSPEVGESAQVYGQMKLLAEALASVDNLQATVCNPFVATADKAGVLLKATGATKTGSLYKFILLVARHSRLPMLQSMALAYVRLYRELNNISQVEIATATALDEQKIKQITRVVERHLGERTLETTVNVDPDLIGGFVVRVDSVLLDASVKNELKKLRLKLLS